MNKLSKKFYLGSIAGGICGGIAIFGVSLGFFLFLIMGESPVKDDKLALIILVTIMIFLGLALMIYGIVVYCILLYKSWQQIQDGQARTTPGKAVGFQFIPLFNLYWIFIAYWGFAVDYNKYIQYKELEVSPLNQLLFLAYCIVVWWAVALYYICGINNNLAMIPSVGTQILNVTTIIFMLAEVVIWIIIADKMVNAVNNLREVT